MNIKLMAAATIFCVCMSSAAAEEFTVATRQIANALKWPRALKRAAITDADSLSLQSMTRIIYQKRMRHMRFKFAAELYGTYNSSGTNASNAGWQVAGSGKGFKAFKTSGIYRQSSRHLYASEIEQLELYFGAGNVDFQIGRQPVSFGTSHYVSVLDVLAPFQPGYLDSSYKPGIDAIRIRTSFDNTGELELIFAGAENSRDNATFLRCRTTVKGFDVELLGGRFRERNMLGFGWEGERRRVNFWGEAALFARKSQDRHFGGFSNKNALSAIFGIEKDTGKNWRHGIAFMHQDFGARSADDLMTAKMTRPLAEGWIHLGSSRYIILNSFRELDPLKKLNMNTMINLNDRSAVLQPVVNISISDESDLDIFAWLKTGRTPAGNAGQVLLRSEFAAFPSGIGFIYRHYF